MFTLCLSVCKMCARSLRSCVPVLRLEHRSTYAATFAGSREQVSQYIQDAPLPGSGGGDDDDDDEWEWIEDKPTYLLMEAMNKHQFRTLVR